jgi:hypothetical protein
VNPRDRLKTAVWFDIDSCLADTRHRWGLSPMADPESSWDIYCAARMGDLPIPGTVAAARVHYMHHQVHLFSGSEDSSGDVTRKWLDTFRVPYDGLRQRAAGDDRANADIKIGYIQDLQALGIEVILGYEDHQDVAPVVYARTGVPVVGVNPFYPQDAAKFQQAVLDGRGGGL